MRRRILIVALSAVVLAVLLLGAPLAVAIERNAMSDERGELQRAALQAAGAVSPTYRAGDPVELADPGSDIQLGVYTPQGRRVAGGGPATLEPSLAGAGQGAVAGSSSGGTLVEAVPVSVGERTIAVVRASSSRSAVDSTVRTQLLALAALALVALSGAGAVAFWQARRLASSMERLAEAAGRLGAGDFSVATPVSGVAEIDRTAEVLSTTAGRLSDQMARERAFAARASHQLRTPLTRLRLELEAGLAGTDANLVSAVRDALGTADHLSQTLDDVLALTRNEHDGTAFFDVETLLTELGDQWRGTLAAVDRPLRVTVDDPPEARASVVAVRQVLHVLVDNAFRHGSGAVTIAVRDSAGAVAIDVIDQGGNPVTWPSAEGASGRRLGLVLARSLTESQGGRLLLSSDESHTRFTILLAAAERT
jgi:signal transduction histidine kinase